MNEDGLADRRDVQRALSIGYTQFFKLIKTGELPSFMYDGRRMCRWADVRAYQRGFDGHLEALPRTHHSAQQNDMASPNDLSDYCASG